METLDWRLVELETCHNFRDLGGYESADGRRIAWGRLYRADTLDRLSPNDLETIGRLDIRTVIDLRAQNEIERHGRMEVAGRGISYHHLPMIDEVMGPDRRAVEPPDENVPREVPDDLGNFYAQMLEGATSAVVSALEILATPGALPGVFHCMAGKDRTGILAAVILSLVDVADEDIVEDYALTEQRRAHRDAFLARTDPEYLAYLDSLPPFARETRPGSMRAFLGHVEDRYGSIGSYFGAAGLEPAVVEQLRDALLTD